MVSCKISLQSTHWPLENSSVSCIFLLKFGKRLAPFSNQTWHLKIHQMIDDFPIKTYQNLHSQSATFYSERATPTFQCIFRTCSKAMGFPGFPATLLQANEEATKHGWCQAELASNKAMREEKTDQVARRSWRSWRVFEVFWSRRHKSWFGIQQQQQQEVSQ